MTKQVVDRDGALITVGEMVDRYDGFSVGGAVREINPNRGLLSVLVYWTDERISWCAPTALIAAKN